MTRQSIQWPPLRSEKRVDLCAEAAFGLLAMKGQGKGYVQVGSLYILGEQNPDRSLYIRDGNDEVLSGTAPAGIPFSDAPKLYCKPQPGANNWQDRLVAAHNKALGMP